MSAMGKLISVRLTQEQYDKAKELADKSDINLATWIRAMIQFGVNRSMVLGLRGMGTSPSGDE